MLRHPYYLIYDVFFKFANYFCVTPPPRIFLANSVGDLKVKSEMPAHAAFATEIAVSSFTSFDVTAAICLTSCA